MQHVGGGTSVQIPKLWALYHGNKRRCHDALTGALERHKSYDTREEHRINDALFSHLQAYLNCHDQWNWIHTVSEPLLHYTLQAATHLTFLHRKINQFCYGFELTQGLCQDEYIAWE